MKLFSTFLVLAVLTCLLVSPVFAYDEVLISGQLEHGGYGGPALKVTTINGKTGVLMGGYGGWFINHTLMIGGGGYGLVNEVKAPITGADGETLYYELGYGGLIFEYVNNSHKLIHFTINTLVGAGGVNYRQNIYNSNSEYESKAFFVIEPGINIELNIASIFRAGLGVSYRYIDDFKIDDTIDEDLNGLSGNLYFIIGAF